MTDSGLRHPLAAILAWLGAALVLLALVARDATGTAGFLVGTQLLDLFGACAVGVPATLALWGAWRWRGEPASAHVVALGGLSLLVPGAALLLGRLSSPAGRQWGGAMGRWLADTATVFLGFPGLLLVGGALAGTGGWLLAREPMVAVGVSACGRGATAAVRWCAAVARDLSRWLARQRLTSRVARAGGSSPVIVTPAPVPPRTADPATERWERPPAPSTIVPGEPDDSTIAAAVDEAASPARAPRPRAPRKPAGPAQRWVLPPMSILPPPGAGLDAGSLESHIRDQTRQIDATLAAFRVEGRVVSVTPGARVILFEWQPAPGVKASRLEQLEDDLALALKAERVRVVVPLPGKGTVGIEVPHPAPAGVTLGGLMATKPDPVTAGDLPLFLGKSITGESLVADLAQMPHLLIAGTTGSGKSVCIHSILLSLLMTRTPDRLRLLLIDPKRVELIAYRAAPHLLSPIITDSKQAVGKLKWMVAVMEARYDLLARHGCRDLHVFNRLVEEEHPEIGPEEGARAVTSPAGLPWIVVAIDELADLMVTRAGEVEDALQRIAQMARGVGIHLVVATQRPSVDVLTGVIKSNLPSRIAFSVRSAIDSRTILDASGAEQLIGKGDMLYAPAGLPSPVRAQGAFVASREVAGIMTHWRDQGEPEFVAPEEVPGGGGDGGRDDENADDALYEEAVATVVRGGEASVSMLQRRLGIGFARAGRLIDLMERRGVVGPKQGSKPREILARRNAGPGPGETA